MTVTCYPTAGKRKAAKLCRLFAAGAGGIVAQPNCPNLPKQGAAFFYGWTTHTGRMIRQCQKQGREFYYADNGYFLGRGEFFRITRNALMLNGSFTEPVDASRFRAFGVEIKPWRKDGRHIVVTTQSELFYQLRLGITRREWTNGIVAEIAKHTDRPVIVCHKPDPVRSRNAPHHEDFEQHLGNAWALVTHSSSSAVKAAIEGIPVFSVAPSMASAIGLSDLSLIEQPIYPDYREPWLAQLCNNQWRKDEIGSGIAWRALQGVRAVPLS